MEAFRTDFMPFTGNLEETRKAIQDVKEDAIKLLADKLVLDRETEMREDVQQLNINPEDVPIINHPFKPLEEEQEDVYSRVAILRDTMRACLTRLEELNPDEMPELDDTVKIIADL